MRIAILSDSHDNLDALGRVLERVRAAEADLILHLGDIVSPFTARALAAAGIPVRAVFGNNDGERAGLASLLDIVDPPRPLHLDGRRFLLYHDPVFNRDTPPDCDYCLYGHTHEAEEARRGAVRIVNPGEAGGWLTGTASFALLDPETDCLEFVRIARNRI
jgi:hypothetical protein